MRSLAVVLTVLAVLMVACGEEEKEQFVEITVPEDKIGETSVEIVVTGPIQKGTVTVTTTDGGTTRSFPFEVVDSRQADPGHRQEVDQLTPDTSYFAGVIGTDINGEEVSSFTSFQTKPPSRPTLTLTLWYRYAPTNLTVFIWESSHLIRPGFLVCTDTANPSSTVTEEFGRTSSPVEIVLPLGRLFDCQLRTVTTYGEGVVSNTVRVQT